MASAVVLFTPASGVPSAPPGVDKLIHLLVFAALAGTGRWAGLPLRPLAVALVAYAAGSEMLQAVLPIGRSGDVLDALVDVAGIALGLGVLAVAPSSIRPPPS
ncbi:VanZ family protein [Pseudonocardia bannensis]|uniref:VanZ family protein n=1 Tax=Pseudonocardia bannensis TaxID=630973 RepID=A0A848DJQ9_9PSEU|nr:VanZ family protein [Pseudonocardia bannensis]NMH92783.1 VanZ family protein [Pseudonocardia bannensis]